MEEEEEKKKKTSDEPSKVDFQIVRIGWKFFWVKRPIKNWPYVSLLYCLRYQFSLILSTCDRVIQWFLNVKMSILFNLSNVP